MNFSRPIKYLKKPNPYLFGILIWLVAVSTRWKTQSLAYNLDYGLYFPDGAHYAFRTLKFLGESDLNAANKVSQWYSSHAIKATNIEPTGLIPISNPVWYVVKPRVIYSMLSVPFVSFMGLYGMLVVPALSTLLTIWVVIKNGVRNKKEVLTTVVLFVLLFSFTFPRWMFADITDGLLVGMFSLAALILNSNTSLSKKQISFLLVIVGLTSYTRFSLPFWLAISFVLLINKQKMVAVIIAGFSSIFSIETLLLLKQGNKSSTITTDQGPLADLLFAERIARAIRTLVVEIGELFVLDKLLLFVILTAIYLALREYRRTVNQYFLAILLMAMLLTAIIGEPGVNFRYQLVAFPFMVMSLQSSRRIRHFINETEFTPNAFGQKITGP